MEQANLCKDNFDGGDDGSDMGGHTLPEDIILEVLLRLPAKSLRRFLCVCKSWHALISNPSFVDTQRSRATTGPFIVAMFGSAPDQQELRLMDMGGNVLKVFDNVARGATTALLAPTCLDLIFVDRAWLGATIIAPASGQDFTVVGTSDPSMPLDWWDSVVTSESTPTSDYSFGRAMVSGDYKVLRLVTTSHDNGFGRPCQWCEVGTIVIADGGGVSAAAETMTWRRRPRGPFFDATFSRGNKATVHGVLYFMPYRTDMPYNDRYSVAAFDLESEKWRPKMIKCSPLEHAKEENMWRIALTELKGTLCVVRYIQPLTLSHHYVDVWLLMDAEKNLWVKEYRIQMPTRISSSMPLQVLGDGTRLLVLSGCRKAGSAKTYFRYMLQVYNSSTKDFTEILEMEQGFNGRMTFYTGSLIKSCM